MIFFSDQDVASGLILTSTPMFLSREQITNGSETWSRIPIRTGDGMCFGLSVWNVNQSAPRRAKSAMLPENASHAFTRSANPSHPISCRKPNCIFTISSPRLASPVYVFFSYSLSRATSICCVLTVSVRAEDGGCRHSPPGARGPVRLLGCRVSFVLLGALRSFRAAGLR